MEQNFEIPEIDFNSLEDGGWVWALMLLALASFDKNEFDFDAIVKQLEENRPG